MFDFKLPQSKLWILLSGFIVCLYHCTLTSHRNFTIFVQNPKFIQYSPKQQYLLFANETHLYVHNGATGDLIFGKYIIQPQKRIISAIQFQATDNFLLIGFLSIDSQQIQYQKIYLPAQNSLNSPFSNIIRSAQQQKNELTQVIGITQNNYYVIAATVNRVRATRYTGQQKIYEYNEFAIQQIQLVSYYNRTMVYAVQKQKQIYFNFYQMMDNRIPDINLTDSVKIQQDNLTIIHDIYTSNQSKLYFVGDSDQILCMNIVTQEIFAVAAVDSRQLHKIQVSQDERIIMVTNATHLILLQKQTNSQQYESDYIETDSYIVSSTQVILYGIAGFSNIAGNTIVITADQKAQVTGFCGEGSYRTYNDEQKLVCTKCQDSRCLQCQMNLDISETMAACTQCSQKYYLRYNSVCFLCPSHCLECEGSYCKKCQPTFVNIGQCKCLSGQFVNATGLCSNCSDNCVVCDSQSQCSQCQQGYKKGEDNLCYAEGLSLFIIIIIIICCVAAVAIIGFVVYRFILPSVRSREPLLTQETLTIQ